MAKDAETKLREVQSIKKEVSPLGDGCVAYVVCVFFI